MQGAIQVLGFPFNIQWASRQVAAYPAILPCSLPLCEQLEKNNAKIWLTGCTSRLLFPFPSHFLSTIPIPVPVLMNSVCAAHHHRVLMGSMGIPISCTPLPWSDLGRFRTHSSFSPNNTCVNNHECQMTDTQTSLQTKESSECPLTLQVTLTQIFILFIHCPTMFLNEVNFVLWRHLPHARTHLVQLFSQYNRKQFLLCWYLLLIQTVTVFVVCNTCLIETMKLIKASSEINFSW